MLDLGFQEFILIAFVLLIVVGPKDLPKVLRSITGLVRKIKSMASDFINDKKLISSEIEDLKGFQNIDDLDMGSLKKDVNEIKNINSSDLKKKTKANTNKI